MPINTSSTLGPSTPIISFSSTTPSEKPARSKLFSGKLPGCSAVSPPTKEHLAISQPLAIPSITFDAVSTLSLSVT